MYFCSRMSLFITSLNSGSNGNCYYIGNNTEAVLIDAGLSCRETEKRMRQLNLPMEKVKAIFISHEHTDPLGAGMRRGQCADGFLCRVVTTALKKNSNCATVVGSPSLQVRCPH